MWEAGAGASPSLHMRTFSSMRVGFHFDDRKLLNSRRLLPCHSCQSDEDREKVYAELKRLLERREVLREKLRILEQREKLKQKLKKLEVEQEMEREREPFEREVCNVPACDAACLTQKDRSLMEGCSPHSTGRCTRSCFCRCINCVL